jgi:hypothetical protein
MAKTTVSKTSWEDESGTQREQYRTTVPKALAEAFDLDGKSLEWEVESQNALTVRIADDD